MDEQTRWVREILTYVCPFIPKRWFERKEDVTAWVSAYRVYLVPAATVSRKKPLVADFEGVRAVFIHWDAPYYKIDQNIIEEKHGLGVELHPRHVYRTGSGILLLLITALPASYDGNDEDNAREKVSFIRACMVALMGRNAAFEHEFDVSVECGTRTVSAPSPVFETPANEIPAVGEDGIQQVGKALEALSLLDDLTQNRVRLALRWYQRSFGDDRTVRDNREEDADNFINCWLALETLAMEGTTNVNSIKRMLVEVHGLDAQRVGELFPIGRIYRLRGSILHEGRIDSLKPGLTKFMTLLFADLLLYVLGLESGENTRRYLDGSANELL